MQSARAPLCPTTWGMGTKGTNYIHNGGTWISKFLGLRDEWRALLTLARLTLWFRVGGLLLFFAILPQDMVTTDIN